MVRKTKPKAKTFEAFKFPYESHPICLQHYDGDDLKTCWFECEEHFQKYIKRYQLSTDEIKFKHKESLEVVVESTGGKSVRVRSRSRQSSGD